MKVQAAGAAGLLDRHQGPGERRPRARRKTPTTGSRASASPTTCAATAGTSSAAAGASTRTWATPTPTCCSRRSTRPASVRPVFNVDNAAGIRNPDGSFYQVGQPISNIASQNQANPNALPLFGQWLDPRLADAVHAADRVRLVAPAELEPVFTSTSSATRDATSNSRPRINTRPVGHADGTAPPGVPRPAAERHRHACRRVSVGKSEYTALIMGFKRRMTNGLRLHGHLHAGGSEEHHRHRGRRAEREQHAGSANCSTTIRARVGPTSRTDARHSGSVAMVWQGPWGINVSPIFLFRSALPVVDHRGPRPEPQRREQRPAGQGLCRSTASATRRRRSATARRGTAAAARRARR